MSAYKSLVTRIQFANVSGFLIKGSQGYMMVDTGHSKTVGHFVKELERLQIEAAEILLILLTHTHFDHAGGAKGIKEFCGAPIAVHRSEVSFLRKGYTPIPKGTRWKGKLLSFLGRTLAPSIGKYPGVEPDIILEDEKSLLDFGIQGKVVHTPGHTAGSLTVILENGEAIVGDNVLGVGTKECYPPFANMKKEVLNSWQRIIDEGVKIVYPAHGRAVKIEELIAQLPLAKKRYGS